MPERMRIDRRPCQRRAGESNPEKPEQMPQCAPETSMSRSFLFVARLDNHASGPFEFPNHFVGKKDVEQLRARGEMVCRDRAECFRRVECCESMGQMRGFPGGSQRG